MRDKILAALDAAYNHGYKPTLADNYQEVYDILGREPTQEEAAMLGEMRSEGFKKRAYETMMRKT
jgi:hypothetical protein